MKSNPLYLIDIAEHALANLADSIGFLPREIAMVNEAAQTSPAPLRSLSITSNAGIEKFSSFIKISTPSFFF